jgi:HK97 family phage major capsid protein
MNPRHASLINLDREKVRAHLADLDAEAEALDKRARAAGRSLTEGELTRISRLASGADKDRAALSELDAEYRAMIAEMLKDPRQVDGPFDPNRGAVPAATRNRQRIPDAQDFAWNAAFRGQALAALDAHHAVLDGPAGARLETLIRTPAALPEARYLAAVADPDYPAAFSKALRYGEFAKMRMTAAEESAFDAVTAAQDALWAAAPWTYGTGSTGGYALPFDLDPTIINLSSGVNCPLRTIARNQILTQNARHYVTTTGVVATYAAEAAAMEEAGPTLDQPTLNAARGSAYIKASFEIWQDDPAIVADLARLCADGRDTLDATKFLTGTGTNEPLGIAVPGTTGSLSDTQRIQTIGADAVAVGDPYAVWDAIPPRYQAGASWVGSPGTYSFLYRLTPAGSEDEPQLIPEFGGPLLGKPFYGWSTMPTALASTEQTDNIVLIAGDFREGVTVGDRLGGTVELVPHVMDGNGKPTGQRGLIYWWRSGVVVHNPNSLRFLEVK